MYCTISGEVPQQPVISRLSGHLFEKRLIEKLLEVSNGICPATGAELKVSDLIAVKANLAVRPRPITATSLPGMLAMFQNEWDDLLMEAHATKQQLHATRKELSHALYQHDAACRVIARLVDEQDDAQKLITDLQHSLAGQLPSGPEVSNNSSGSIEGLDSRVITHMTEFWKKTSRSRKKRLASARLKTVESLAGWSKLNSTGLFSSRSDARDVEVCQQSGAIVACGGDSGIAWLARPDGTAVVDESIADTCAMVPCSACLPGTAFATSGANAVTLWRADKTIEAMASMQVSGVASVAAHPTGNYLAAMSSNASWGFMAISTEMGSLREVASARPACPGENASAPLKFHPDGLILAMPTTSSLGHVIRIWDVKEQKNVHSFEGHSAPISCVAFSENGYHMASSSADNTVKIWDLRKLAEFKSISCSDRVSALSFDHSGKFLAHAYFNCVQINAVKDWTTVCELKVDDDIRALSWAVNAEFLVAASSGGGLDLFGSSK